MRGSTSRSVAGISTAVLVSLLLFTVVPAFLFLPQATTVANGGEDSKPTSTVKPLPEFTNAPVVPISYRSVLHGGHSGGGDDDDSVSMSAVDSTGVTPLSGVDPDGGQSRFWTELFYRSNGTPAWTGLADDCTARLDASPCTVWLTVAAEPLKTAAPV